VRTSQHAFDAGRRLLGRYARESAYLSYDPAIAEKVFAALDVIGSREERDAVYYEAHKAAFDKHYDFSPGYLNRPYGVGGRIKSWEPWSLTPYPSALWTVQFE
jgi:hypothetical protein